ncbi:MAG: hypothetical protein QOF24_1298 [Verrucomicrobiota bacterium]|jgi:hypothetical protein
MKRIFFLPLAVSAALMLHARGAESSTPDEIYISRDAARALLDSEKTMNPAKGVSFRKLDRAFPDRDKYSVAEVLAIRDGAPKAAPAGPVVYPNQTGNPPRDTWTKAQVKLRFDAQEKIKPTAKGLMDRLEKRVPNATWYTTEQVLNAETVEKIEELKPEDQVRYNEIARALQDVRQAEAKARQGIRSPRIRRDWRDVIYDEDASPGGGKKTLGDLEGALFSYVRNGKANTDTWNAHAAVILPITYQKLDDQKGPLWRFALAPSVTYDRVTTNGDPKVEVDSLFYRVGLFYDIYDQADTHPIFGYGLQVRAAGVYATDHNHSAGLRGFEADFEPRFHVGGVDGTGLGYRLVLWRKFAARSDDTDKSIIEGQLRTWLHLEGGDIDKTARFWTPNTGSFFRLGPTVQLQLSMPSLPGDRALSLTAVYSYLAAVSGSDDRSNYFRASFSYDLFRNVEFNHKVSLSASYEKGGLNFTKQKVDTFTLGLGVLF